ncbi:MAG TPA: hypothetical protein VLZ74_10630 [Methylocella sp.]|nr:hypothetical protein [Methylocella sp.]
MGRFIHHCAVAAALSASAILPLRSGFAQESPAKVPPVMDHDMPGHGPIPEMMEHHGEPGAAMQGGQTTLVEPTLPGQDAFGAIQEIVQILEADPKTDWSKVNLEALRQHLIDMNEVTLKAVTFVKPVDGGLEIAVTGNGRTIDAIQRIVMAHARVIEKRHPHGWSAKAGTLPDGVLIRVTSDTAGETQHIRGLGFIGIMVSSHHHQLHHLAVARGEKRGEKMH